MRYRPKLTLLAVTVVSFGVWSCASLKDASPVDPSSPDAKDDVASSDLPDGHPGDPDGPRPDGQTPLDAGPDVNPADLGAGPLGALPSGYCCGTDNDCRHRHCELVNGTKMCLDYCLSDDDCSGIVTGFHCAFTDAGYGHCQPAATITTCAPQGQYQHGTKPLGTCCTPVGDGRIGTECLSGVCTQLGSASPYFCSVNCGETSCPDYYTCGPADDESTRFQCYFVKQQYACAP